MTPKTNLYEAAGCILQTLFWPTDRLWDELFKTYGTTQSFVLSIEPYRVGLHFRYISPKIAIKMTSLSMLFYYLMSYTYNVLFLICDIL